MGPSFYRLAHVLAILESCFTYYSLLEIVGLKDRAEQPRGREEREESLWLCCMLIVEMVGKMRMGVALREWKDRLEGVE